MGLILSTKAEKQNFNQLITLKKPVPKEAVITDLAKVCIEESAKARLGWGHSLKKFVATNSVYTTLLFAPIAAVLGSLWFFADKLSLLLTLENLCIAVPSLGAMIGADLAFGKIFGIRPITVALLAALDAYRSGVKRVTDNVERGYINEEEAVKELLKDNKKVLMDELKNVYSQIAAKLEKHSPSEIENLRNQIPLIVEGLTSVGLTRIEVAQILAPLNTELRLLQKAQALKIEPAPQKNRFWIF